MTSVGTYIAKALSDAHTELRKVFFDSECIKLYDTSQAPYTTPLAEMVRGWYLDKHEYNDVATGKKYQRLVIDDPDGCRLQYLRKMLVVEVEGVIFKTVAKPSFWGSVASYEFKVQPTGERI